MHRPCTVCVRVFVCVHMRPAVYISVRACTRVISVSVPVMSALSDKSVTE